VVEHFEEIADDTAESAKTRALRWWLSAFAATHRRLVKSSDDATWGFSIGARFRSVFYADRVVARNLVKWMAEHHAELPGQLR